MEQLLPKDAGISMIEYVSYCNSLPTGECRPESKGDMSTDMNPAYGVSGPHKKLADTKRDYEIPEYTAPATAPDEGVYEGVY